MRNTVIFTVSILLLTGGVYYIYDQNRDAHITGFLDLEPCTGSLTILYDNYVFDSSGRAEWGFSCLIEIGETAVLFDTGGEPEVLRHNIEAFDVDVSTIDCVVLSHEHWDHVGGMEVILSEKPGIPVYLPEGIPYIIMSEIRSMGGDCIEVENATKVCGSMATTLTLNGPPKEQALIIQTQDGVILVTGCSHPGVHNLARNAYDLTGQEIQLVIGGFHLGGASEGVLEGICDELDAMGVQRVSATHCTGDESREYFRDRYGENFVEAGVGFHMEF